MPLTELALLVIQAAYTLMQAFGRLDQRLGAIMKQDQIVGIGRSILAEGAVPENLQFRQLSRMIGALVE